MLFEEHMQGAEKYRKEKNNHTSKSVTMGQAGTWLALDDKFYKIYSEKLAWLWDMQRDNKLQ